MKRKNLKRILSVALAGTLAAGILTGCGSEGKGKEQAAADISERYEVDPNTPAWQLDTAEEVDLTWYVNADWWNTDWGSDVVTKKIKEDLNLNVTFITGDDTKLNTFFAGEDMPDIITVLDANSAVVKSADSWAYALNDLADEYDPYFYQAASEDTLNWYKMEDGKTYGYPDYSNSQKDYDSGYILASTAFAIRQDIYQELGEPEMGTPEEFLDVLGQIKAAYPDLTPFGFNSMVDSAGSLGADLQNFLGVPIEDKDGNFYDRNLDEDYLAWIKVFNEAYKLGYISDDSFSDDGTAHEEKIKVGKYASVFIGGTPQRSGPLQIFMNANPEAAYIAIDGPQSTQGNAPTLSQSGLSGWMINFITKDCKDPAKAIQVFTYLISEYGQELTMFGIEGETFQINGDGLYELLPEAAQMKTEDNDRYKKEYRLSEFIVFGHDRLSAKSADRAESIKQMQDWGEGKLKTQFLIENIDPDQGTAEARSLSAVNTNWNTTLVSLIRSADDAAFEQILADYRAFQQENNWEDIVAIRSEKMQKNREKLGL